jgi:hypothetical protein
LDRICFREARGYEVVDKNIPWIQIEFEYTSVEASDMGRYFTDQREAGPKLFWKDGKKWESTAGLDPEVFDLCFDKNQEWDFTYDPSKGNLLIDLIVVSPSSSHALFVAVPFVPPDPDNQVRFSNNGQFSTDVGVLVERKLITKFELSPRESGTGEGGISAGDGILIPPIDIGPIGPGPVPVLPGAGPVPIPGSGVDPPSGVDSGTVFGGVGSGPVGETSNFGSGSGVIADGSSVAGPPRFLLRGIRRPGIPRPDDEE